MGKKAILFFDGHCNLCNRSIDFVMRRDRKHRVAVASLQGETARAELPAELLSTLDTLVLKYDGRTYTRSSAALRTAGLLGFPWSLARVLLLVPPFIRNAVYDWVSRNRLKWYGKRETCRMPSPEERSRFLP